VPSPKELTQLSIESKQQTPTNKKAKGSKKNKMNKNKMKIKI